MYIERFAKRKQRKQKNFKVVKTTEKMNITNNAYKVNYYLKIHKIKAVKLILNLTKNNFFISLASHSPVEDYDEKHGDDDANNIKPIGWDRYFPSNFLLGFSSGSVLYRTNRRGRKIRLRKEFIYDVIYYFFKLLRELKRTNKRMRRLVVEIKGNTWPFLKEQALFMRLYMEHADILEALVFRRQHGHNGCRLRKKKRR